MNILSDEDVEKWNQRRDERNKIFWEDFFKKHFDKEYEDPTLKFSRDILKV